MYKVSDKAVLLLLKFFKGFLKYLGEIVEYDALKEFAKSIPETMYMINKSLWIQKDDFEKYAVCPQCKSLYQLKDCVIKKANGDTVSLKCTHVSYPNHPHRSRRRPCGTVLMKSMKSRNGNSYLYPKQVYCFKKLTESIQELIHKSNFLRDCELWRE